jgi:uncharacterized phage-associated protein
MTISPLRSWLITILGGVMPPEPEKKNDQRGVKKPIRAIDVADCFVQLASKEGFEDFDGRKILPELTPMKLMMLCYFAQATHLALNDIPLFEDEIEARAAGPFIASVWEKYGASDQT